MLAEGGPSCSLGRHVVGHLHHNLDSFPRRESVLGGREGGERRGRGGRGYFSNRVSWEGERSGEEWRDRGFGDIYEVLGWLWRREREGRVLGSCGRFGVQGVAGWFSW